MTFINLNDAQKKFEETRLSQQKIFKIKSIYTTDYYSLFEPDISDANSIIVNNYPSIGFTSYGLIPLYSYKTNKLKETSGNSRQPVSNFKRNENAGTNIFSNPIQNIPKSRQLLSATVQDKVDLDSNYFGIKRLQQELKPFSKTIAKKNIVKHLYNFNKSMSDSRLSQRFNYGFYNYNCFNFFNIGAGERIDNQFKNSFLKNTHKNALIYSNQNLQTNLSNQSQIKLGANQDLSINFWINPKRMALINNVYNPGCILHLPNIVSIYLIDDRSKINANNQSTQFKIMCHFGDDSNKLPDNDSIKFSFISNDNLLLNTWYNISLIINGNIAQLYIDDKITTSNFEDKNINMQSEIPSILTIGNKICNEDEEIWTINREELKNYFFNKDNFISQHLNLDEINKVNTNKINDNEIVWNTKIFDQTEIINYATQSQALNAELYNLMIFNSEININRLNQYAYGSKSIPSNLFLSFYLPCVYISDFIKRKGYITLGKRDNVAYRSVINPYFSHKIYGHELSIESFSLDIVNLRKPFILGMNGQEYLNNFSIESNAFNTNDNSLKNRLESEKIQIIKDYFEKHNTPNQVLNKIMVSNLSLFDKKLLDNNFIFDNIIYRNNFILPCDNGKSKFDLNDIFSLDKIKNMIGDSLSVYYHLSNPHYVKIDKLYMSDQEYSYQSPEDFFNNIDIFKNIYENPFVDINIIPIIPTSNRFMIDTFLDVNNVSNIQKNFYDQIKLQNSLINIKKFLLNTKNININKHLLVNPIFKNIDGAYSHLLNYPENIIYSSKSYDNNSIVYYPKYFNSYFSIEGELGETYSVLFDISNIMYSNKIRQKFIKITDIDLAGTGGCLNISVKDNGHGVMYRADCNGIHATWAHIGHVFYNDGLLNILHPGLSNFGENNFTFELKGEHALYTLQIDIPVEKNELNVSQNKSYIADLKPSGNLSDLNEDHFVYLTGVNLHDENLNIIGKAKFAQPIVKRTNDRYNIRLKMDF